MGWHQASERRAAILRCVTLLATQRLGAGMGTRVLKPAHLCIALIPSIIRVVVKYLTAQTLAKPCVAQVGAVVVEDRELLRDVCQQLSIGIGMWCCSPVANWPSDVHLVR